jgi:hypothetical protein
MPAKAIAKVATGMVALGETPFIMAVGMFGTAAIETSMILLGD